MTKAFEQFNIGDWVKISEPNHPDLDGKAGQIVFKDDDGVKVKPRIYPVTFLYTHESAKKHLTLLEAV